MIAVIEPPYPLVACDAPGHERPEPGYAVCSHVLKGEAPIADVERASPTNLGVIVCAECFEHGEIDDGLCVCAHCAAVRGWLGKELN